MATIKSTVVTGNRINADVSPPTKIVPKNVVLHDVTAETVGLGNVDNTSDVNKPISTLTQAALDLKANQSTTYSKTEVDAEVTAAETAASSSLTAHTDLTNNPHTVTATQVGLGNVEDKSAATIIGEIVDSDIPSTIARDSELSAHTDLTNNPHSVTATQVGLGNVDNTSDADKPISTATQNALDLKANQSTTYTKTQVNAELAAAESSRSSLLSSITAHANLTNNPHSVTATQVGLGNVDNESKAVMFTDPTFTGNPQSNAAPTSNDHLTNKTYVDTQVAGVVDSAPEALDTLNELAAALGDDASFATTTANSIGEKLAKASNLSDLANATTARSNLGLGNVENKSAATIIGEIVDSDIPSTITRDSELSAHTDLTNNPHSVTKAQVDLGNVVNESKATMFTDPTFTGDITSSGDFIGLYHKEVAASSESGDASNYYHDSYTGARHLNGFLKNSRSDIIRYRAIDDYEYWNGSAWVADSSKIDEVKKLLDGRQDTSYAVPSRDYKFRFTVTPSTSWPLNVKVAMQTSWSGSSYPGSKMIVEEYSASAWETRVTAKFGNGNSTPLETADNNCGNWGLNFISTSRLHTGKGGGSQATRITVDFYGWSPNNGNYVTIPLQNLFITSNYSGTENTDYSNLLDYDRNISAPSNLSVSGNITLTGLVDGRDVATDGTKLDGIATGADVTPSWVSSSDPTYATESYVGTQISSLVDSSPAALDTLNELAAALGDDANFSTTVTNSIATKAPKANPTFTGDIFLTDGDVKLGADGDSILFMGVSDANYRRALYATNDNHFVTNRHTNGDLILMSNNGIAGGETERLRFKAGSGTQNATFSNVNVGIGTTSPATKLEVNGDIGIGRVAGGYTFREVVGGNERASMKSNSANELIFSVGGAAEKMRITSAGDVGIGTNAPGNKLHIVDTSAGNVTYPIRIQNDNTTNNSGVGIEFGISTDDAYTNARIQATREDSQASAELSFQTKSDSSTNLTERMRIDRNGNVGIGTTSPDATLDMDGHFRLLVSPENRIDGQASALIKGTDGRSANLRVVGPVTVTHDLFKNSGDTGGFADNSNHFHTVQKINRITQQSGSGTPNERVQEQYYAIENNNLKNSKAAFWNWHRVSKEVSSTAVSLTNLDGWDVSGIQDSSNRTATSQVLFPTGGAEATTFTFDTAGNNPFALNDVLRITVSIDFEGAIVAATNFAKVTAVSGATATVVLYGGNYKTTDEVADGNSQTAVTTGFSIKKIDTAQYMPLASGTGIDVLSDSSRTTTTDTFKITFASAHGLELNDTVSIITDNTGGFQAAEVAFVKSVGSTTEATFVYGRVFEPESRLALSDIGSSSVVGVLKGTLDGLHRFTAGDQLMHFNADNEGRYKSYQIGPGSEVGADCIAIGKNVYNKDASTIKIGYDNAMLDVRSDGVVVAGDIESSGSITGTTLVGALSTAAQTNITSVGTLTSLTTSGNITAPRLVTNEIQCIGTTGGTAQPITYDSKEHRFRDYDETPNNLMVIKKTDGVPIGKVGINHNNPVSALHVVGGHTSGGGISNEALRVVGSGLFTSKDDIALVVARDTDNNAGNNGGHVLKIKQDVSTSNTSNLEELNIGFVGSGGGGIYTNSTALASYIQVANNKNFEIATGSTPAKRLSIVGSTGTVIVQNSLSVLQTAVISGTVGIGDKIYHNGDTDTAIRFPAADTFTIETAGSERLRVNSTGEIGIGKTAASGVELDVSGDIVSTGSVTGATLAGTISTAAQPNITSVGNLTGLTVSGDITLDQGAARTIKVARSTTGEDGESLTIEAGQFESGTEGNGGSLTLKGGGADSGDGTGGHLILQPGAGDNDGTLQIKGSNFLLDSTSAKLAFRTAIGAGTGNGTFSDGSTINTNTVQAYSNAILNIYGKSGTTAYPVNIIGGSETGDHGSGADVTIRGGQSGGDSGNGGDVTIEGGSGETTNGKVILGGSNTLQIDVNSTLTAIDSTVTAKGYSLNANTFTVVSTTSTLAASTNGLTVILQNTGPITITLPTLAAGHVTTFISETNNAVTFVGDTGITVNSFGGNDTTAGIFAQCQVIYKTTTVAFLGGNLV